MYRAKVGGKRFAIYQRASTASGNRLELVEDLRQAIDDARLRAALPAADRPAPRGQLVAVEALVRWQHPAAGRDPAARVPAAGRGRRADGPLTDVVLDEALRQCAAWRAEGRDLSVAVNISATNLLDPQFTDDRCATCWSATGSRRARSSSRSPRPRRSPTSSAAKRPSRSWRDLGVHGLGRRLRRRLHLAGLPERPRRRRAQARSHLRQRPGRQPRAAGSRARALDHRAGPRARPARRRPKASRTTRRSSCSPSSAATWPRAT